jgi:Uma2 family endonuclease
MSVAMAYKTRPMPKPRYTYADYAIWPDYPRFELINGEAIKMSAPSWRHQEISMSLSVLFGSFLRGKKCKIVAAPFDVRLNYKTLDNTVVQPDLMIICDEKKIENGKHCLGTPDMVVEILSESTRSLDKLKKFNIYLEAGVSEYWVVHPEDRYIEVYILENGKYHATMYGDKNVVPVHTVKDCTIDLSQIFEPVEAEPDTAQHNE